MTSCFRQEALSTYHRYECTVVDFLIASGMSIICFLAYRCISQKPLQFFLENKHLFDGHDIASGTAKGQEAVSRYLSTDYRSVRNTPQSGHYVWLKPNFSSIPTKEKAYKFWPFHKQVIQK